MTEQIHLKKLFNNIKDSGNKFISLELYPNSEFEINELNDLCPTFCAFTWCHGDVTKPNALQEIALAQKLRKNGSNMLMHLAARNLKREDVLNVLNTAKENGVKNILALKGGAPKIEEDDSKCDFPYAIDLVRFIKQNFDDYFNVAVSGYPIGHPESKDPIKDLQYLKEKVDVGGDIVVCQAVFDLQTFRDFYKRCMDLKINAPILPGVYIINSYTLLKNLMSFCKVVPQHFLNFITENQDNEKVIRNYGINYAAELIKSLLTDREISIPGIHIFCFNNLDLVDEVYKKLDFAELKVTRPLSFHCNRTNHQ